MLSKNWDFKGYATKYNLKCSDGRTIRSNAFRDCDGSTVSMVWNHDHNNPENLIGTAYLKHADDGVIVYGKFNNTKRGQICKELFEERNIQGLSICANQLVQKGGDVLHGTIREVSLVIAPANPGAVIDYGLQHGADGDDVVVSYLIGDEYTELKHGADMEDNMANEKTIGDVFDTMTDEQREAAFALAGSVIDDDDGDDDSAYEAGYNDAYEDAYADAYEDALDDYDEYDDDYDEYDDDYDYDYDDYDEGDDMKHNVFYGQDDYYDGGDILTHSDKMEILGRVADGSSTLKNAMSDFADANMLEHDAVASGFVQDPLVDGNISWLFPEYKDLRPGAPELITNDMGWVTVVMDSVSKAPMTRIRINHVDIRNIDELKAKGYKKGKEKQLTGNFNLVRRTVDPQTVYVKSQIHRDDMLDLKERGIDYVNYLYNIDKMQMNETLAMAFMLGDFRDPASNDKIEEAHIKPIWTDDELFTIHRDVDVSTITPSLQGTDTEMHFGNSFVYAESLIESLLFAKEDYRGTGQTDMFITPHMLNVLLLSRDSNGRRIYGSKRDLEAALDVRTIHRAEQFNNRIRTDENGNKHRLLAIVGNMGNYTVGGVAGGELTHFTDFDLDFNIQKSLLETRLCGMITRVKSFIVLEEPVSA